MQLMHLHPSVYVDVYILGGNQKASGLTAGCLYMKKANCDFLVESNQDFLFPNKIKILYLFCGAGTRVVVHKLDVT